MKKTLLAVGLVMAVMPLAFAGQASNTPAAGSNSAQAGTSTTKAKKHKKSKTKKTKTTASAEPAAAPAK